MAIPFRSLPRVGTAARGVHIRATVLIGLVGGALLLAGCAALLPPGARPTPAAKAMAVEPMLSAAGFNAIRAETPQQLAQLKTLPPLQINMYSNPDGSLHYWYADPYHCQCIYYGPDAAYQRYEDLKLQRELAQRNEQAAEAAYEAAREQQLQQQQMMMNPFGLGFGF